MRHLAFRLHAGTLVRCDRAGRDVTADGEFMKSLLKMTAWTVAMMFIAVAAPVRAASPEPCSDDRGSDRCSADNLSRQRQLYAAEAIEDWLPNKIQAVRAFFVDSYGQDVALVTLIRRPGNDPRFEVSFPTKTTRPVLTGVVSSRTWQDILDQGRSFDRDLVPLPQKSDMPPAICLHGWMATVEALDENGVLHRKTASACGKDGLALSYAFTLATAAVQSIPYCAALDSEGSRNDVTRLVDCTMLAGDRAAAAQAYNRLHTRWLLRPNKPEMAAAIADMFHDRAEVTWPGQSTATGWDAAPQAWALGASRDRFSPRRYFGESANRVRIEGEVWPRPKSDQDRPQPIKATAIWTRENGFDFRLRSFAPD